MKRPRVHELKQEYGSELDWVIPFTGDWHLLSNYQSVLMKVYHDAGLELAESSGHRGETLASIKKCSSYKRTHQFLVQVRDLYIGRCLKHLSVQGIVIAMGYPFQTL